MASVITATSPSASPVCTLSPRRAAYTAHWANTTSAQTPISITFVGTSGIVTPGGTHVPSASRARSRCRTQTASIPPMSMIVADAGERRADEDLAARRRGGGGGQGVHQRARSGGRVGA